MRAASQHDPRSRLLPEGRRWGFGAHSVVPYLTAAFEARPGDGQRPESIRNPVFPQMEQQLRALRRGH